MSRHGPAAHRPRGARGGCLRPPEEAAAPAPRIEQWGKSVFEQFDTDKNGTVSLEEMRAGFKRTANVDLSDAAARELFRRGVSDLAWTRDGYALLCCSVDGAVLT